MADEEITGEEGFSMALMEAEGSMVSTLDSLFLSAATVVPVTGTFGTIGATGEELGPVALDLSLVSTSLSDLSFALT